MSAARNPSRSKSRVTEYQRRFREDTRRLEREQTQLMAEGMEEGFGQTGGMENSPNPAESQSQSADQHRERQASDPGNAWTNPDQPQTISSPGETPSEANRSGPQTAGDLRTRFNESTQQLKRTADTVKSVTENVRKVAAAARVAAQGIMTAAQGIMVIFSPPAWPIWIVAGIIAAVFGVAILGYIIWTNSAIYVDPGTPEGRLEQQDVPNPAENL